MAEVATKTKEADLAAQQSKQIAALEKKLDQMTAALSRFPTIPNAGQHPLIAGQGPNIRAGENTMGSQGFSFIKMFGLLTGRLKPEQARCEQDIARRMDSALCPMDANHDAGYEYATNGGEIAASGRGKALAPLSTKWLNGNLGVSGEFAYEMKGLMDAGVDGYDPGFATYIARKTLSDSKDPTVKTKALSWLNELSGGSLVAPPEQGELIELLRNKEALVNAGARTVPLPPQGRMKYPRQTAASLTYWVGESSPLTESQIGTGEVTLQAKKLAVLIKAPNELIRFASPAAEALIRDDMTKSLALGLDLAGLEGNGTDTMPRGVINFQNLITVQSSSPGPNGNFLAGRDIYRMIAAIEEANAEFEGWIMRPKTLYRWYQLRADAVAQGDQQGPFLFNLIREAQAGMPATLGGFPVTKSTQVSQNQTLGTGTGLTYILGGMWSDLLIGMFGAIEFAATTVGDTAFVNDQTWVRGILSADIQARHETAFAYCPQLNVYS
jgi:HK97 family phage major capsid protein